MGTGSVRALRRNATDSGVMNGRSRTTTLTDRIVVAIGAVTVLLGLVLASNMLAGPSETLARPHPSFASMLQGERSAVAGGPTLVAGVAVTTLMLASFWLFALLGLIREGRIGPIGRWMTAAFAGYGLVFAGLLAAYRQYLDGATTIVGGFPAATAWVFYGVAFYPWIMLVLLVWRFDKWFFTPRDQERFAALVAQQRARSDGA